MTWLFPVASSVGLLQSCKLIAGFCRFLGFQDFGKRMNSGSDEEENRTANDYGTTKELQLTSLSYQNQNLYKSQFSIANAFTEI